MDATTLENDLEGLVAVVDGRRAEGLSVAAACRATGISTSTYYRRRRSPPAAPVVAAVNPASIAVGASTVAAERSWPFAPATPRAPLYWDQVFADEMSDSFVRREFGGGELKSRARVALAALVAPTRSALDRLLPGFAPAARRIGARLGAGPLGVVGRPLAAAALFALLVVTAGWMVSVAADPAAWLSHPDPAQLAVNAGPVLP